jgi:hypothetical protein
MKEGGRKKVKGMKRCIVTELKMVKEGKVVSLDRLPEACEKRGCRGVFGRSEKPFKCYEPMLDSSERRFNFNEPVPKRAYLNEHEVRELIG